MNNWPRQLRIGVVQQAMEVSVEENRDKIIRWIGEAKAQGCRLVVFPEEGLHAEPDTSRARIAAAVEAIRAATARHGIYVIFCLLDRRRDEERLHNRLIALDPRGEILLEYDKMANDARFNRAPDLFEVDGVPCSAIICADRWIRRVEDLPVMQGACISFECSNNYGGEWIGDLGWYWYAPRAVRNGVFVVFTNTPRENPGGLDVGLGFGHGHSAVFAPDGSLLAAADGEADQMLVVDIEPARATRAEAEKRRTHPLLCRFWEAGLARVDGVSIAAAPFAPLLSPEAVVRVAAAQMACTRSIDENLRRMEALMAEACAANADAVVFPALCVTGALDEDIEAADPLDLERALRVIQDAARRLQLVTVFGMPYLPPDGKRRNSAFVVGEDGELLTRYDQVVVEDERLFAPGQEFGTMWFRVKGVPAVVSIGRDALWNEIAELAAVAGAQIHLHLEYDRDLTPGRDLLRKQLWANLASFRTFTATVNAASPEGLANPSADARGGSMLWDDTRRVTSGKDGRPRTYSASCLVEAGACETLLVADQRLAATNPHFQLRLEVGDPTMKEWYILGAQVVGEGDTIRS